MTERKLNQIQDLATNPQELQHYEDRVTKALEVLKIVEDFVKEHTIRSPDTIGQCDRVILNAQELIFDLCEAAGYFEEADEEKPSANGHYIGLDR